MKEDKSNYITIKWIISIIVSVGIGTFITYILGNTEINVWITRIIGAAISVIVELMFYYVWLKKAKNKF